MTQTQQHNVPAVRFPEYCGDWAKESLSNICDYRNGGAFEQYIVDKGKYFLITLNSIDISGKLKNSHKCVNRADWFLKKNDLIMVLSDVAHGNFLGLTDIIPDENKYVLNQRMGLLRQTNFSFDLVFIQKQINRNQKYFKLHGQGSSQQNLSKGDILKFNISAPTLSEQQKIASFLSSVDCKIEQLGKKKALLEQYKKGMMQKLFSQELRFKDAQGKDFSDWEEKRLGDFYEFKSTNSLSRDKLNYEGGEVRNIHYGDIHTKFKPKFYLSQEDVPFINTDVDLSRISDDKYCKVGDLVIADASEDYDDIGKTIELINLNGEKVLAGLHTLLARISSNDIYIGYGAFVMACATVRKQIKTIAQGTKVLGISVRRMEEIKLPIPSTDEQQKIADLLSSIDRKIDLIATELDHAKSFKKGLLQQMFI